MAEGRRPRGWLWLLVGLVVGGAGGYWARGVSEAFRDFEKAGFLEEQQTGTYLADREANLKEIHRALTMYADSEAAFPQPLGWMDAAWQRLQTRDLPTEEARKKLQRPGVKEGYGYALNRAVAGKAPEEAGDPKRTVLVFESEETTWDAAGDPSGAPPESLAVTVDGTVLPLKDLAAGD